MVEFLLLDEATIEKTVHKVKQLLMNAHIDFLCNKGVFSVEREYRTAVETLLESNHIGFVRRI